MVCRCYSLLKTSNAELFSKLCTLPWLVFRAPAVPNDFSNSTGGCGDRTFRPVPLPSWWIYATDFAFDSAISSQMRWPWVSLSSRLPTTKVTPATIIG